MSDKYVLLEHFSGINVIIHDTFKSTQRIKFTAFDVSTKYIIFGVNSGGIYIFAREPCQFLKLIPSTHGRATLIAISPDEDNLAIAVASGLIIILEDCFDTNFQQQVFAEHENATVTALKWNGNDLYCGDSTGCVSLISFKNFLTKTMFQTPVSCLMHLDSQIVQLDTYSRFLLVSTKTRTLLCDTDIEKYRQIGKKARDGNFGACFFNAGNPLNVDDTQSRIRGIFETLGDNERLSTNLFDTNVKIYCARPGARLWQADFDANVVVTHQFRSSLSQTPSRIIQSDESDALVIKSFESGESEENFSFNKIFTLISKFVLTFANSGFYIFEPSCGLLHWGVSLSNIQDIKIVDSYLYIWHGDLEVRVLSLSTVEDVILRSLMRKKYRFCAQMCVQYLDDVLNAIDTSKRLHLISALETKLDDPAVLDKMKSVFERLKECAKIPKLEKFQNGIVTVNIMPVLPEPVEDFTVEKEARSDDFHTVLLEQYKVNKTHANIETNDFIQLIKSTSANALHQLLVKFNESNEENAESWCKATYLKNLSEITDIIPEALQYGSDAFLEINSSKHLLCKCNFPLPQAHKSVPKYPEIGRQLMQKSPDSDVFVKSVPYMYKFMLQDFKDVANFQERIPLIVQFSDPEIVRILSSKITYDMWDECVKVLLKLKSGQCVNCGTDIDILGAFEWTDFSIMMVESIKPSNALKLLKHYTKWLPKGELSGFFYQYCIFAAVTNTTSCSLTKICREEKDVKKEFETSVAGYLRKKYLRGDDYYDSPIHKPSELVSNCDQCQLPLNTPIIDEATKLTCGHNYHRVCFVHNNHQCPLCESTFIK